MEGEVAGSISAPAESLPMPATGEGMQAPEGAPAAPEDAEISDTDSDDNVRSAADRTALAGLQAAAASRGPALPPAISVPPQNGAAADDSGTDTDDDGNLIAQARLAREAALQKKIAPKRAPAGVTGKPRVGGGISLKLLIEEGYLIPGENVLTSEYKGANMTANLNPDGRISYTHNGELLTFESPSAFSIFFKRLVNPARKADDGWKTVRFRGKFLDHYKMEFARQRADSGPDGEGGAIEAAPIKRQRTSETNLRRSSSNLSGQSNGHVKPPQAPPNPGPSKFDHHPMACSSYSETSEQPFKLAIAAEASVLIDLHSHLSNTEAVGVLGGTWDRSQRLLTVHCARPVKNAADSSSGYTVAMDSEDRQRVQQDLQARLGLRCVGTYHSRPSMPARPSGKEVFQQTHEQHEHRDGELEPWVTAICSPFAADAPDSTSTLNWIHIAHPPGVLPQPTQDPAAVGCTPCLMETDEVSDAGLTGSLSQLCEAELQALISRIAPQASRADALGMWRGKTSHLDKFKASLAVRLPDVWPDDQVEAFVNYWADAIKLAWMTSTPQALKPAAPQPKYHLPQLQPRINTMASQQPLQRPQSHPAPRPVPQSSINKAIPPQSARAPQSIQQPGLQPSKATQLQQSALQPTAYRPTALQQLKPPQQDRQPQQPGLPNGHAGHGMSDGSTAQGSDSDDTESEGFAQAPVRPVTQVRGYGEEDDTVSEETQ